jgi:hypothetical protein
MERTGGKRGCRIWRSHSGSYEFYLKGYNAVHPVRSQMTFRRNMSQPSKGWRISQARNYQWYLFHACFSLGLFFYYEDEGGIFLRKVGWLWTDYTALYPRWEDSSKMGSSSKLSKDVFMWYICCILPIGSKTTEQHDMKGICWWIIHIFQTRLF